LLFGLGWPQWLTIAALVGGLILTFWVMARASIAYENARRARERDRSGETAAESLVNDKKES
jgi:hypothetical protein